MAKEEADVVDTETPEGAEPVSQPEPAASDTTPSAASATEPAAAAPPPAEKWEDIRDYAKANGLDLSHIADSDAAAKYLVDMARNNSAYAQYGQQLAPHYNDIQQYLAQRAQQPRQQAAPEAKKYFGLPEYDPQWLEYLERDAAGNVVPKVGAPPDILGKVVQYQKALANFQTQFYQQPEKFLEPMIQDKVAPLVQQAIQNNLKTYQDQVYATNFLAQNSNWLHYHDTQGQVIRDPVSGGYALTPEGQLFVTHLKRAQSFGMQDIHSQQQYAMDQMRLAYYAQVYNQQQQQTNAAQQNQQFLQDRNRRVPNSGGSLNAGPQASQNANLSLSERLRNGLKQQGITDADLMADTR